MKKIVFILFLMMGVSLQAQETPKDLPPKIQDFIQYLESKKKDLQGGAIALLYKGRVVYKTAFGYRKGKEGLITSQTLFPLASVSKAVSATALSLLIDEGKIRWTDSFHFPFLKYPVSLSHIMSHTTGYHFTGNAPIEQGLSRSKIFACLKNQKPKTKPGHSYRYSNFIFSAVEEALNEKNLSLKTALHQMRRKLKITGLEVLPFDSMTEIAYPHRREMEEEEERPGDPLPFPPYYPKAAPAAAGIFASLDAMIEVFKLSFGYRPDLISEKALKEMYKPIVLNDDIFMWTIQWPLERKKLESYYLRGWRLLRVKGRPETDLIFHPGFINGINSFIGYLPSQEVGLIILLNQRSGFPVRTGLKLWEELLNL